MDKRIKIRFLINTLNSGGAEKVLVDLLNALPEEKYKITVAVISGKGKFSKCVPKYVRLNNITSGSDGLISKLWRKLVYKLPSKLFCFLFLKGNYDIEIAYLEGNSTKIISSLKTKAAKIAFVHSDFSVYNSNLKKMLKRYDTILVETSTIPDLDGKNVMIITNIEDLIDASVEIRKPIYYKKEKTYCNFILLDNQDVSIYLLKHQ